MLTVRRLENFPDPICSDCGRQLPEGAFYAHDIEGNLTHLRCKDCVRAVPLPVPDQAELRVCSVGKELKPPSEFYVKDRRTGRLFTWCKDHHNEIDRARYAAEQEANPKPSKEPITERKCSGCGLVLPIAEFGWKNKAKGWRRSFCKKCHNDQSRDGKRQRRQVDRSVDTAYYQNNREKLAESQRIARLADPEKYRQVERRSKIKHADRVRTDTQRRRDSLRGRGGKTSAAELRAMFARYGWRCVRCGELKPLDFDHVDPRGPGNLANGQPLCTSCNSWKLAKTHDGLDFRIGSKYDTRSDLTIGTVDLAMADLPVPEWVHHPRREIERTEKLCLGPLHGSNGLLLPVESFPIRSVKSGKPYRKTHCQACLAELLKIQRAKGKSS